MLLSPSVYHIVSGQFRILCVFQEIPRQQSLGCCLAPTVGLETYAQAFVFAFACVLLLGFSKYGKGFINRVIGQFSIVFFDYKKNLIFLIRDRLGQKPLFYSFQGESLVFGSNLKSLVNLTDNRKINQNSISEYLNIGVVTSPNTIFENICVWFFF